MYLDHLKSTQAVATPSVSFSDVMQEAMYATEVCSAAGAYLIKAEAEMLVLGSEAEGESGFWAKVKTVVRKIWEAIKNLANKIFIFIKSIPGKIMAFYQKRVMVHSLKNLPELWEKAKAEGRLEAAKDKGIKYLAVEKLPSIKDVDMPEPNFGDADKAKEAVEKVREKFVELRDKISKAMNDKDSDAWADASTLNDADVAELITAAKTGKLPASAASVIKKFEEGTKALRKISDIETKKYDAAYRNKDQEAAKEITTNLSSIRSLLVEHATNANFCASMTFRALSSKANAIKSIAGISGKAD
jgi:hypothetical protein